MTFEEWYERVGVLLPCWKDKMALARAWEAGAEAERAKCEEQTKELDRYRSFFKCKWEGHTDVYPDLADLVWKEYVESKQNDQG